jgi:hypothetical protein
MDAARGDYAARSSSRYAFTQRMVIMHEMEKTMCEAIAKYTPFSADDVFTQWQSFKSFDLILRAIDFARVFGITSVREAANHLVQDYIREQKSGPAPFLPDAIQSRVFIIEYLDDRLVRLSPVPPADEGDT